MCKKAQYDYILRYEALEVEAARQQAQEGWKSYLLTVLEYPWFSHE